MKKRSRVGYPGEMRRSKQHLDSQIERLLAGGAAPDLGNGLSELVHRLQEERSGSTPGAALASALAEEARKSESVPTPVSSRVSRQLPTRWRRRIMISTFLSSLAGKMAIGAVALASTTGGLAATGNLPEPIQEWSAAQLADVGIDIPSPETDDEVASNDVLGVVESGLADTELEGEDFGKVVADEASGGASDVADEASEIADGFTDGDVDGDVDGPAVADGFTDVPAVPAESSSGADAGNSVRP